MKIALWILLLACAITPWTAQSLVAQQLDPTRGSKNVTQVVPFPMESVMEAAKKAVQLHGCDIKKESSYFLMCKRARKVGVIKGSGGEKVTVSLSNNGDGTLVLIKTHKGLMGRLVKKNWSTPIFNEIVKMLEEGKE